MRHDQPDEADHARRGHRGRRENRRGDDHEAPGALDLHAQRGRAVIAEGEQVERTRQPPDHGERQDRNEEELPEERQLDRPKPPNSHTVAE